jgi:predicted N-acetyltransferase YhbS
MIDSRNDTQTLSEVPMSLTLRTIAAAEDQAACFDLLSQVFDTPPAAAEREAAIASWVKSRQGWARLFPSMVRGAFLDGRCAGSYQLDIRQLRLGAALLSVGCIGTVVTHPELRNRGIASALMWDAVAYAREQRLALLLLTGIPNFYHRFGFATVADRCEQQIALSAIRSLPRSSCVVREARRDDAEALLALYRRHHDCFERSLAIQQALHYNTWLIAVDSGGQACGYLVLRRQDDSCSAFEVGADSWPAALALLHAHAESLPEGDPSEALCWPLPLAGTTYYLLADQIELCSIVRSIPRAAWMARPGSIVALAEGLLSHWRAQLRHAPLPQPLRLRHVIGDDAFTLEMAGDAIALATPLPGDRAVRLTPDVFLQLLSSYRPLIWALEQPGQQIPEDLLPILERLYPVRRIWVPRTDKF